MKDEIFLTGTQVLNDLKNALVKFDERTAAALLIVESEIEDTRAWLEERRVYWLEQIDLAEQKVASAEEALSSCESGGYYDEDDNWVEPECSSEEGAVEDARNELRSANDNLQKVGRRTVDCEIAIITCQKYLYRFRVLALPEGIAFLDEKAAQYGALADVKAPMASRSLSDTLPKDSAPDRISVGVVVSGPVHAFNNKLETSIDVQSSVVATHTAAERVAISNAIYKSERAIGGDHVNEVKVLKNGRKVLFKPVRGQSKVLFRKGVAPESQYRREVAASILDEELGLGLVPPTEIIEYKGELGSAQIFKEGFVVAARVQSLPDAMLRLGERQLHDWQLFDDLACHLDRHDRNYLFLVGKNEVELALIDNGLAFPSIRRAKGREGPLEGELVDRINLDRLQKIITNEQSIRARFYPLLDSDAIDLLFERARIILTKGYYGSIYN